MIKLYQCILSATGIGPPEFSEDGGIMRRGERHIVHADQLEAWCKAPREQFECPTPSLRAKAFRGELVPQVPNDEPASLLLERLRAERATASAAGPKSRARARQSTPC